ATERQRADCPTDGIKLRYQPCGSNDVGNRIPGAHLVEANGIGLDAVHFPLRLSEPREDADGMLYGVAVELGRNQGFADQAPMGVVVAAVRGTMFIMVVIMVM